MERLDPEHESLDKISTTRFHIFFMVLDRQND